MSFDIVCANCGAPSSPSVGVCPFCKGVMMRKGPGKENPTVTQIGKFYNEGRLEQALALAKTAETQKPEILKNQKFALLYAKILIEAEGPSSKIKSVLSHALLENPEDPSLIEYLEVVEAKSHLSRELNDVGEIELSHILRRSPKNVHAAFLLGSHLFWIGKETQKSLKYLEQCHRLRPNFLRAAACLGALYKTLGLDAQAGRMFRHCAALESNKEMKAYFKGLAAK